MSKLTLFLLGGCLFFSCKTSVDKSTSGNAPEGNKAIVDTYFRYFNNHEWQKMADLYSEAPEMKDPSLGTSNITMTKADIVKKYQELHKAIPDVQDRILSTYITGDNVIVEFVSSGTVPDSTRFELPICTIFEIKNGKITKDLTYYDNFESDKK